MHYVIALVGVGLCIHGYKWSADALGAPPSFERSLITDLRFGFGLILLALAVISYQLRKL